jgi:hypothetical protein
MTSGRSLVAFAPLVALLGRGQPESDRVHNGDPTMLPNAVERAEQQGEEARSNQLEASEIPSPSEPIE